MSFEKYWCAIKIYCTRYLCTFTTRERIINGDETVEIKNVSTIIIGSPTLISSMSVRSSRRKYNTVDRNSLRFRANYYIYTQVHSKALNAVV